MQNDKATAIATFIIGLIAVIWLALIIAPLARDGPAGILTGFGDAINNPLQIIIVKDSLKTVLLFICAYAMGIGIYIATKHNYRKGVEHGSAKWAMQVRSTVAMPTGVIQ